jgi:citrate lyase subunit beta/citryl-CoA lyase
MTAEKPPQVGTCGPRGDEVRSDVCFEVTLRDSGGIVVQGGSKVDPYYGDAIRNQVHAVCEAVGVKHAHVDMQDGGALPFAIAARLECAAQRALGRSVAPALPEPLPHGHAPSARDRLRRSRLYLPGNAPRFFTSAALYGADAIILDLEDAVAATEKDAARIMVRNALRCVDFAPAERMVRINPGEIGLRDLDAVVPQQPDLILIPKCDTPEQVLEVDAHLASLRDKLHVDRPIWLMPILETARAIENAYAIASASSRVAAVTIGLEDYTADLGVQRTAEGIESLYARMALVNAAKAAGVQAIDSVYSDVADQDGLRASTLESRRLGFEGRGCIHPRQIPIIHEAFAPEAKEIQRACRIVAAFEQATAAGLGVVSLGTKMIDPPVVKRAQRTVALAVQLGLLDADWHKEDPA